MTNIIFGVKIGDDFQYIGKTNSKINKNNKINNSDITTQYSINYIRDIFINSKNVEVIPIKILNDENWYDKKLEEIVEKYKEKHPLKNQQWMLDGKHGFWQDKTRDEYTIKQLSESKYKKVVEYNENGDLIKIWKSIKEVAVNLFNDYSIIKGKAKSKFYGKIRTIKIKNRFINNSYWFTENELIDYFNGIPLKLNFFYFQEKEKIRKQNKKQQVINKIKRYTVVHYNSDQTIKITYENTSEAAFKLNLSRTTIQRLCRGFIKNDNYNLKYGNKTLQPYKLNYPDYVVVSIIKQIKPKKIKTEKIKTRTRFTVEEYINNTKVNTFNSITEAALFYNMKESKVRSICYKQQKKINLDLRFGMKKQNKLITLIV